MPPATPAYSKNLVKFLIGVALALVIVLAAATCWPEPAHAQSQDPCSQSRTSRLIKKGSVRVGRDSIRSWYVSQDSVADRCRALIVTDTVRDTVFVPQPPPLPSPVPAPDTVGTLVWSEDFESGRGTWDDDGLNTAATSVIPSFGAGKGQRALQVVIPSGGSGGWVTKYLSGIRGGIRASFLYRADRTITTMRLARLTGGRIDNPRSSDGNASTCPTGTNFFSATFEYVGGNLGFYSQYVGMPGQPNACWSVDGVGRGAVFSGSRTVSANAWHRIVLEVIPNAPADSNGSQRIWIDGVLVAQWTGMRWRTDTILAMNGVELDPYISGGGGPITVWYDDVQVRALAVAPGPPAPPPPPPPPPDTTPPPPSGGPFAPPDLHSISFDKVGDDAKFTVLGVRFPASWHTADPTGGRNGSRAMRVQLQAAAAFEPVGVSWSARGRTFYRWYFRTQGTPGGNVKGVIVRSPNGEKVGDVYGGEPCWSFDREGEAICFDIGLSYTQATANCGPLANGQWHSIEVDYNRNAGANVEARIWCDGKAVVMPAGPAMWGCCPYPTVQFVGGDRATNTPTTIRTVRQGQNTFGELTFWETISQGVNGVVVWIDDIAVSTQRIGP